MGVIGRALLVGARAGIVAGVLYFSVLAALIAFGALLGSGSTTMFALVLFVGAGVACGLGLGLAAGLVGGTTLAVLARDGAPSEAALRVAGGAAAGGTVLILTLAEQLTGMVGLLTPDLTTVVVIPTAVAVAVGTASAPGLVAAQRGQPKRPLT
ncbi:MAG TPA: hypothetical protein VFH61_16370 [Thermoleophilia bacterium]|nr:hypothetical protein [Thermoleophilia bacterium]